MTVEPYDALKAVQAMLADTLDLELEIAPGGFTLRRIPLDEWEHFLELFQSVLDEMDVEADKLPDVATLEPLRAGLFLLHALQTSLRILLHCTLYDLKVGGKSNLPLLKKQLEREKNED